MSTHQINKLFVLKLIPFYSGQLQNQRAGNYKKDSNNKITTLTVQSRLQSIMWLALVITCLEGRFGTNCSSAFLKILEISWVKQGLFQIFQKSRGWFIPKIARYKHVNQTNKHLLKLISFKSGQLQIRERAIAK